MQSWAKIPSFPLICSERCKSFAHPSKCTRWPEMAFDAQNETTRKTCEIVSVKRLERNCKKKKSCFTSSFSVKWTKFRVELVQKSITKSMWNFKVSKVRFEGAAEKKWSTSSFPQSREHFLRRSFQCAHWIESDWDVVSYGTFNLKY